MSTQTLLRMMCLLVCLFFTIEGAAQAVDIPDPNLRAAIETALGKTTGASITVADMETLTSLIARHANISNLTGLEHATNLTRLELDVNSISDLSPISGLTNLTTLFLPNNSISDLSPISGLTNLTTLVLWESSLSDLSPISGLTNLTWLDLGSNSLSDLSPISGLTNLTWLGLVGNSLSDLSSISGLTNLKWLDLNTNRVSDLSPISGLTNLTRLTLDNNSISDLSPLVSNAGLGQRDTVYARTNPLNTASINTHIPILQGRGVTVLFDAPQTVNIPDANLRAAIETALGKTTGASITVVDMEALTSLTARNANIGNLTGLEHATNLTWLALFNNRVSDLSPISGLTNLTWLDLNTNRVSNLSPISGLTNLTGLTLYNNSISDLSPLVSNTGLGAGETVDARRNPLNTASINTHIPALQQRGVEVLFDAPPPVTSPAVNIPDPNLRRAIEAALSKAAGASITVVDMEALTSLTARNANISNLTGLEHATNLTRLALFNNHISDISPISGLTNLTFLTLNTNRVSDISPLSGLTNLTGLTLYNNSISDLAPLVSNTGLGAGATVDARMNPLNTASINTHIPTLQQRGVTVSFDAPPPVTSPAVNIPDPNLRRAVEAALGKAAGATITVVDMEALTSLTARNANISNLTGLEHATNLTRLALFNNHISDISPLSGLTNLTFLTLNTNRVSNITAISGLTNLTGLTLYNNRISDLSPLVSNTGLGAGATVDARMNPLNTASINTHIPTLQGRGVTVSFDAPQTVNIPDANLRAAIETTLGKTTGATITVADMKTLTSLTARDANISNLTGLEHATNLTDLDLINNNISDLSPISGLTNLTGLHLEVNTISNITAISGLTNLRGLSLGYNSISDVSALAGLTNLVGLLLTNNSVSDVATLAGLTNLIQLYLENNSVSDISPLVANTGLGSGDTVNVQGNPLSSQSLQTHIPTLQGRGVTVHFDAPQTVNIPDPNLRAAIEGHLGKTTGASITVADMKNLTWLVARYANISNLTGLEHATNLTGLDLNNGRMFAAVADDDMVDEDLTDISPISALDLSPLAGLTNLTELSLESNSISDLSPLAGLTNLTLLYLYNNNISNLSPLSGLTNLTELYLENNSISDLSPLAGLTNLTALYLAGSSISDLSPLAGLTNLTELYLESNSISDLSPLVANTGLGSGDTVWVEGSPLSSQSLQTHIPALQRRGVTVHFDTAAPPVNIPDPNLRAAIETTLGKAAGAPITVADMETLTSLTARDANISNLTGLEHATNLTQLNLINNNISDLAPFVSNTGLGAGVIVDVTGNPLDIASISIYIPILQQRGVTVQFNTLTSIQFDLSVPKGTSLIHVPLKVTAVDGAAQTITSIADLYDALGGASTVNFLITYNSQTQEWHSYLGASNKGTPADAILTDDKGIFVSMKTPTSIHLSGTPLGENGSSTITLHPGLNVVGLPLNDSRITRVSDLFTLDGIQDNVPVIILTDNGDFKTVGRAGDPGDIAVTGGQAFILNAQQAATVAISGAGWTNGSDTTAAPLVGNSLLQKDTTPVVALRGAIVDEATHSKVKGFRVTVKNLSTGRAVTGMTSAEGVGYQLTVVAVETGRAARIGDILEITAQSPHPLIGVEPLRYTITAEDVKQSLIQLPDLILYEIPSETELLQNYPNPFNPETWIPYRLAEDAHVTLTIYGTAGRVVRTIDVGHRVAAVYESRSKAVYWDGRNEVGEPVASGVYFYHLSAGDFASTRRMLIIK